MYNIKKTNARVCVLNLIHFIYLLKGARKSSGQVFFSVTSVFTYRVAIIQLVLLAIINISNIDV